MVEYRSVLLVVLVHSLTISSFKYINETCSSLAKISTDLETKEGDTVQLRIVYCKLSHLENELVKFNFDISWAFNATTDINNYNLIYVSVVFWCLSPFELDFINPHNMEKKTLYWPSHLEVSAKRRYKISLSLQKQPTYDFWV